MSLVFREYRTDASAFGTLAATATAMVGFPIVFFAFGLVALGLAAATLAALGTAAEAPQLSLAGGSLVLGGGIAVANCMVALIVLSITAKLFVGARPRLTALSFAAGYTALASAITFTTEINLGWSVTGVLVACLIRYVRLSAAQIR